MEADACRAGNRLNGNVACRKRARGLQNGLHKQMSLMTTTLSGKRSGLISALYVPRCDIWIVEGDVFPKLTLRLSGASLFAQTAVVNCEV